MARAAIAVDDGAYRIKFWTITIDGNTQCARTSASVLRRDRVIASGEVKEINGSLEGYIINAISISRANGRGDRNGSE